MTPMSAPSVVVGSVMVDRVLYCPTLPVPGVTVIGDRMVRSLGGKGLNQAVQIHRLGGNVTFIGAIGKRSDGDWVIERLKKIGIPYPGLRRVEELTGNALICVDVHGQNQIGVAPGANMALTGDHVRDAMASVADGGYLLTSLEVPFDTLRAAYELAKHQNRKIVCNAAPWRDIPDDWWGLVDGWILNEGEAEACFGKGNEPSTQPGHPAVVHSDWIIITRGPDGADIYLKGQAAQRVPALPMSAVDAVGAGDSFAGALIWQFTEGTDVVTAAEFACRAASIACTRRGAAKAMPNFDQVQAGNPHAADADDDE